MCEAQQSTTEGTGVQKTQVQTDTPGDEETTESANGATNAEQYLFEFVVICHLFSITLITRHHHFYANKLVDTDFITPLLHKFTKCQFVF